MRHVTVFRSQNHIIAEKQRKEEAEASRKRMEKLRWDYELATNPLFIPLEKQMQEETLRKHLKDVRAQTIINNLPLFLSSETEKAEC